MSRMLNCAYHLELHSTKTSKLYGIAGVSVINFDANTIRITVNGENAAPQIELFESNEGLIFGVVPTVSTAQRQQPQAPTTPPAQPDELPEVIVTGRQEDGYNIPDATTATRTDTPIRDIPQSIQVVPQQVLEDRQVTRLEEALRNVSGVFSGNNFGGTVDNFNIRGFADSTTLRDGFKDSFTESGLILREPANIEQVEVLKGPASVLYGNVEPGGVVNVLTKKPLADPFYNANLAIGTYNFYRPSIDLSGPLIPEKELLYRLNIAYENAGSFRDFVDSKRVFVAPVLSWQIGEQTNLSINTSYLYDRRTFDRGIVAIGGKVADIERDRIYGYQDLI